MVVKKRKIRWDNIAKDYLKQSIQYISHESPQNASKVKNEIRLAIKEIPANPERYPADKFRANNSGAYRAFNLHGFRISYFIAENEIRIVRIRHTKQEPLEY